MQTPNPPAHLDSLRARIELIQGTPNDCGEADEQITRLLRDIAPDELPPNESWSVSVDRALALSPPDYDFTVGVRDGVSWAWIQPSDDWQPAEHEARHDHPAGSGLVVANSPAMAMCCAALLLRLRRLEAASCATD